MNEQTQYITNLAKQYKAFVEQPNELFLALNQLPESSVKAIYDEYGDAERNFQPVNVLRAEIARQLLEGAEINQELVEEIKDKIRTKNTEYFSHFSADFLRQLVEYPLGKRDMFGNWNQHWRVFHTFFYRGKVKETVQIYLEQISKQLIADLELGDYTFHYVDFYGANNFGADSCWIALYPQNKLSHKNAHQFFLKFKPELEVGRVDGWELKTREVQTRDVETYAQVLVVLQKIKSEIVELNDQIRGYYKFDPGSGASVEDRKTLETDNIIFADYSAYPDFDISKLGSLEELNDAMGFEKDNNSYEGSWNLWLLKSANIGDIVFAGKGLNKVLGICTIVSEYFYDETAERNKHRRSVKWLTNNTYQYEPGSAKGIRNLFRPDFFAPTKNWQFIIDEYVRLYPDLKGIFGEHHLKFEEPDKGADLEQLDVEEFDTVDEETSYWWLNANPNQWKIDDFEIGKHQTYTSHNERGNKRRVYKYFEDVREGDVIIGYETSPTKQVKAIYEVSKHLHHSENEGEVFEFEIVEKLEIPVYWSELQNNTALKDCEVLINNQGSLFKLTENEFDIIREIIDSKNIIQEAKLASAEIQAYSFETDPDKPFINERTFFETVELLKRKKNIILQGAPGVGKTFIARKLAYQMMGEVIDAQIETVQFHQSYSYEDFIQGIRPNKDNFALKNGTFYLFCKQAMSHPKREFFFIIDEINRGNLSKIFGELMMLIESDKRDKKFELKLTYAEDEEDRFYVPSNVHIIGTMNTADRSLAIVDYALRRRFAFVDLEPAYNKRFRSFLEETGISAILVDHICSSVAKVNEKIKSDIDLGSGFQIGHSYFCTKQTGSDEKNWFQEVLRFEIKPLLEEIWFDDLKKVDEAMTTLNF